MRKDYINRVVLDTYRECSVSSFPINCFDILQQLGIACIKYSSLSDEKQRSCRLISDDAFQVKGTYIYYNDSLLSTRIRFSLMHELGHIRLGHTKDTPDAENEADFFASQMLMPHVALYRLKCKTADEIRNTFDVSCVAANRALREHRSWSGSKLEGEIASLLFPPKVKNTFHSEQPVKSLHRRTNKRIRELENRVNFMRTYFTNDEVFTINENRRMCGPV